LLLVRALAAGELVVHSTGDERDGTRVAVALPVRRNGCAA
jgi:hypothetical protein